MPNNDSGWGKNNWMLSQRLFKETRIHAIASSVEPYIYGLSWLKPVDGYYEQTRDMCERNSIPKSPGDIMAHMYEHLICELEEYLEGQGYIVFPNRLRSTNLQMLEVSIVWRVQTMQRAISQIRRGIGIKKKNRGPIQWFMKGLYGDEYLTLSEGWERFESNAEDDNGLKQRTTELMLHELDIFKPEQLVLCDESSANKTTIEKPPRLVNENRDWHNPWNGILRFTADKLHIVCDSEPGHPREIGGYDYPCALYPYLVASVLSILEYIAISKNSPESEG
jgi:hypothetical protein